MKKMTAGYFKAKCLAVIDEVQANGEAVVITKNGKPVAKLVPVNESPMKSSISSPAKAKS